VVALLAGCVQPTGKQCLTYPTAVDFGEQNVAVRPPVTRPIDFDNPSGSTVRVSLVEPAAPFAFNRFLLGTMFDVEAGGHRTAEVSFDPTADALLHVDRVAVTTSQADCEAPPIELSGRAPGTVIAPGLIDFGVVPIAQPAVRTVTITNTRRVPVTVRVDEAFLGPFFRLVTPSSTTVLGPGLSAPFDVSLTPPHSGQFDGKLRFTTDLLDVVAVALRGEAGTPRWNTAPVLDLGEIPTATIATPATIRHLLVANTGTGALRFDFFDVTPQTGELTLGTAPDVPQGEARSLSLLVQPSAVEGPRAWTLTMRTNDPVTPMLSVAVTANVSLRAPCAAPVVLESFSQALTSPTTIFMRFINQASAPCFVDGPRLLEAPESWTVSTPDAGWLLVPANSAAVVDLVVTDGGTGELEFQSFGFPGSRLPLIAQ